MSSFPSSSHTPQHRAIMYTLKNFLLDESNDNKTHPLSLLQKLNIKTDSIECNNQNSKTSSTFFNNYNNSYVSLDKDNLSELYAHYHIDPQMYPPPDLRIYSTVEQYLHPLYYLPPSRWQDSSFLEQRRSSSNNSSRRFRDWRRKQKRLRLDKNIKQETNNIHHRNMITVRRVSCHDIHHPQMIMKKQFGCEENNLEDEKIKNNWNKNTRSGNLIENKSQRYKPFPIELNSSPTHIDLHTSPIQSTVNKLLISPSTSNIPRSNILFQQQDLASKMSNSESMIGLKVNSLRDLSASSMTFSQLLPTDYNQTKPEATTTKTVISDSQMDSGSLIDNSPHPSTTTSSIVPHFSSTIAPNVPLHVSSSLTAMPFVLKKTETIAAPTFTNENIQDLVDQLKNCIASLNLLLQNKKEHEKHMISTIEAYSDGKRNKIKSSQSLSPSSISVTSTPNRLISSKKSISNENNLVFEDITVRRCNSFNNQEHRSNIPSSYNDQHEALKRCLLVYYRDRNINSNGRQRYSSRSWNNLALNQHLSSQSTTILAEEDDEYEL